MRRLALTIAYDGAPWQGWQSQPSGLSVQDQIETALRKVTKTDVTLYGSGRTDAGVHALAQIAHCDVPEELAMTQTHWIRALNTHLPRSVRILEVGFPAAEFHARFNAKGKVYRYRICRGEVLSPFEVGRAWHVYGDLDIAVLEACAKLLCGTHDFARLSAFRGGAKESLTRGEPAATTRTIVRVDITQMEDVVEIEFEGDGFLYKMVRLITGAMMHVARGGADTTWFRSLLDDPTGTKNHQCAPADGLYLVKVLY